MIIYIYNNNINNNNDNHMVMVRGAESGHRSLSGTSGPAGSKKGLQ